MGLKLMFISLIIIFFGIVCFCKINSFRHHSVIRKDFYYMNLKKFKPLLFFLIGSAAIVTLIDIFKLILRCM